MVEGKLEQRVSLTEDRFIKIDREIDRVIYKRNKEIFSMLRRLDRKKWKVEICSSSDIFYKDPDGYERSNNIFNFHIYSDGETFHRKYETNDNKMELFYIHRLGDNFMFRILISSSKIDKIKKVRKT